MLLFLLSIVAYFLNPQKGGTSELQIRPYHPTNVYTIYVYVACEHSSFKNLDLVSIQSSDPRAQKFTRQIFVKVCYFHPKSSDGYNKLKLKDKTLNLFVNDLK
jgi:hypothetical protein